MMILRIGTNLTVEKPAKNYSQCVLLEREKNRL